MSASKINVATPVTPCADLAARTPSRPLKKSADWRHLSPARTGSEMMAIANVGLGDPPAAVELAVRRCAHADAANSFGSRVRL